MSLRRLHRCAGEILAVSGNRLLLIEAIAVLLLFIVMYSSLSYACSVLLFLVPGNYAFFIGVVIAHTLVVLALTALLAVPTVLGVFRMAYRMTAFEPTSLVDMFFAFSDFRTYCRMLAVARMLLLRVAIVWLLCEGTYLLFVYLIPPVSGIEVLCGFLIGIEVLLGAILVLRGYPEICAAFRNEEMPFSSARREVAMDAPVFRGARFILSFVPSLVIGFFTIGILWLADTLPRMLVAYFLDCGEDTAAQ